MVGADTTTITLSDGDRRWHVVETEDPYAGLNRQQKRKAMAVEARAYRKRNKRRGR